jgi:hypothetical protein
MNPFQALLKSRKFLVLLLDTTVSLVLYFSAKYLAAGAVDDIKTVILALQPVVLVLIGAIAYEDGQAMKAEATAAANKQQA